MTRWASIGRIAVYAAGALVLAFVAAALLASWVAPYSETDIIGEVWSPPGAIATSGHGLLLLGTDQLGRDLLSRILYGTRNSILVAFVTTILSFAIGSFLGFAATVLKGPIAILLNAAVDLLMAIPTLIVALLVLTLFGASLPTLILTLAILDATRVFRLCWLLGSEITALDYFESARLRGEGVLWLLCREILPNTRIPLANEFGLRFCNVLLFIATLSFLGLGVQPPAADLGNIVRDNATAITYGILTPLYPALAIAGLVVGVNGLLDRAMRAR